MLENGFTPEALGKQNVEIIGDFLENEFIARGGIAGMGKCIQLPDCATYLTGRCSPWCDGRCGRHWKDNPDTQLTWKKCAP